MSDSQSESQKLSIFNEIHSDLEEDCQMLGLNQSSKAIYTDDLKSSNIKGLDYSNQLIIKPSISNENQASDHQNPVFRARKRIRKIRIFFNDPSEVKAKIISQIQLLESQDLNETTKIVLEPIFGSEDPTTRRLLGSQPDPNGQGTYKNLPKILGKAIISFSLNLKNSDLIKEFINKENLFFEKHYKSEVKKLRFSVRDFIDWMYQMELKKVFIKLKSFRDIWGYKSSVYASTNLKHRFYCMILKRISKYFLKNEFVRFIFKKVSLGRTLKKNAVCFLKKIPIFMRGLKNPGRLTNLDQ